MTMIGKKLIWLIVLILLVETTLLAALFVCVHESILILFGFSIKNKILLKNMVGSAPTSISGSKSHISMRSAYHTAMSSSTISNILNCRVLAKKWS